MKMRKAVHLTISENVYNLLRRKRVNVSKYVEKLVINDSFGVSEDAQNLDGSLACQPSLKVPLGPLYYSTNDERNLKSPVALGIFTVFLLLPEVFCALRLGS
jgi:hypothetical protein